MKQYEVSIEETLRRKRIIEKLNRLKNIKRSDDNE